MTMMVVVFVPAGAGFGAPAPALRVVGPKCAVVPKQGVCAEVRFALCGHDLHLRRIGMDVLPTAPSRYLYAAMSDNNRHMGR